MPGLGSRAVVPRTVRSCVDESALAVTRHAPLLPVCGLVVPGCGLLTATGSVGYGRALGASGHDDCTRDCLAVVRPGVTIRCHTGPATGHVTVAGLVTALLLLTALGLGRGVGCLDRVTRTARRLLILPAIMATLGCRWSLPLRLQVAPLVFLRPLSWTLSGCSSACLGPWIGGVWF